MRSSRYWRRWSRITRYRPESSAYSTRARARAALCAGQPGRALGIFTAISAGWPGWAAEPAGRLGALIPEYRRLIPGQIDDLEAMERLGVRLDAYASVNVRTLVLGGDRSPAALEESVGAVASALPAAERVVLPGQGHTAHLRAPRRLARTIQEFASRVLGGRPDGRGAAG